MAVTGFTKSRVVFSTVIIAGAAFGWNQVLTRTRISTRDEGIVCGVLALLGLISLFKAGFKEAPQAEPLAKEPGKQGGMKFRAREEPKENPVAFLGQSKFWGVILVVCGGIFYSMSLFANGSLARLTAPLAPLLANSIVVEAKPREVPFPDLRLQGVISNGDGSSAVINGTNFWVGELIGAVRLIGVRGEEATVELDGRIKVLTIPW